LFSSTDESKNEDNWYNWRLRIRKNNHSNKIDSKNNVYKELLNVIVLKENDPQKK